MNSVAQAHTQRATSWWQGVQGCVHIPKLVRWREQWALTGYVMSGLKEELL